MREKFLHTLFEKRIPRMVRGEAEARETFTHTFLKRGGIKGSGAGPKRLKISNTLLYTGVLQSVRCQAEAKKTFANTFCKDEAVEV